MSVTFSKVATITLSAATLAESTVKVVVTILSLLAAKTLPLCDSSVPLDKSPAVEPVPVANVYEYK